MNLGGGWTPGGEVVDGSTASYASYFVGQSFVALVHRRVNLLVEVLWTGDETFSSGQTSRAESLVVSPGVRFGIDLPGGLQIVPGVGVPIGVGPSANTVSIFGYLSVEFPFSRVAAEHGKG